MARLNNFVHIKHPETGQAHVFGPADPVPAWAQAAITNPKAWAIAPEQPAPAAAKAPSAPTTAKPAVKPVEAAASAVAVNDVAANDGGGDDSAKPKPPPKSGAGSGKEAWSAYATSLGAEVKPEATREDIIAAIEQAGFPTA